MIKYLAFLYICLLSCNESYRTCPCTSKDPELCIYQNLLTNITEQKTYNFFLGKDEERIFTSFMKQDADTAAIRKEIVRLQHKLFNDSNRFAILVLDTSGFLAEDYWRETINSSTTGNRKIQQQVLKYISDTTDLYENLSRKFPYQASDFQLCTAKLRDFAPLPADSSRYFIGRLSLSRICFNDRRDAGVAFLKFKCGEMCGYGSLLYLRKYKNQWQVDDSAPLWIN